MRLIALFLALAVLWTSPVAAFADDGDSPDAAIALVREALVRKGLPNGGPMVVAPIARGFMTSDPRPGWFVDTDAGLFLVWTGEPVGPLTSVEADIVETACLCDADALVLPPPSAAQVPATAAKMALYVSRTAGSG